MRIGRRIIIPAIISLGVTGSVLAGSAISVTAGPAPSSHVHVVAVAAAQTHYHD